MRRQLSRPARGQPAPLIDRLPACPLPGLSAPHMQWVPARSPSWRLARARGRGVLREGLNGCTHHAADEDPTVSGHLARRV